MQELEFTKRYRNLPPDAQARLTARLAHEHHHQAVHAGVNGPIGPLLLRRAPPGSVPAWVAVCEVEGCGWASLSVVSAAA
jgi:hypothetical protein